VGNLRQECCALPAATQQASQGHAPRPHSLGAACAPSSFPTIWRCPLLQGRVLTAEFPAFFLVNCYVPNSGDGLKRLDYRVNQWDRGGCPWGSKAAFLRRRNDTMRSLILQTFLPTSSDWSSASRWLSRET
jgi:hypothetical protein